MADFVAVLRKTIGTLGDNTPEMREKVFEKARATIETKLAAIDPPPPAPVVERQRKALEDAIAVVRVDYAEPEAAEQDEDLEDVFATLKSMGTTKPQQPPIEAVPAAPEPEREPEPVAAVVPPRPEPQAAPAESAAVEEAYGPEAEPADDTHSVAPETIAVPPRREPVRTLRRRLGSGLIAAVILLLAVLGGGYALWLNKDDLFGRSPPATPVAESPAEDAAETAGELAEAPEEEEAAEEEEEATAEEQQPPSEPAAVEEPKFTQRLMPDGTEVDEGPAGGPRSIGEGSSVASAVQSGEEDAQAQAPAAAPDAAEEEPAQQPAAQAESPAVAVGQRAIFYEERTSSSQGSAELGSIVWSIVQESPGGDLPPEPAIRAEATVPGKDVQLRMTIRRNGDESLPASHIVEMIFLTPEGFEGGAIANVSRISFKETEQAAGNPLIGIPAKIADGFFLIALGDAQAELDANVTLLRTRSWVDIPIVYQTGRRALLTLEKGIPGERVFDEALRAWTEATSG